MLSEANVQILKSLVQSSEILLDEPMSKHTTFKVGGPAEVYITPSLDELMGVISFLSVEGIPYTVIGNGSNLLVGDGGIKGAVIEIGKGVRGITIAEDEMIAGAGNLLVEISRKATECGMSGLEFACGIPGTLGGGIYMNAGAYGGEIKDVLISATVFDTKTGRLEEVPAEELSLSYRHSALMDDPGKIVLSGRIRLKKADKEVVQATTKDLLSKRAEKQPLEYPSAGSTFKRPEGDFAARLIDVAGLRGYSVGGAQVSEKHTGFVVNKGQATAKDITDLMQAVSDKVFETSGIRLEPEVRMIGEFI